MIRLTKFPRDCGKNDHMEKILLSGTDKEISWNLVHDSKRSENHHSLNFYGREKPNTFSERFFREI